MFSSSSSSGALNLMAAGGDVTQIQHNLTHGGQSQPPPQSQISESEVGVRCAFCFMGGCSQLGQSELMQYTSVTAVQQAHASMTTAPQRQLRTQDTRAAFNLCARVESKHEIVPVLTRTDIVDEIELVGLPDDVALNQLDMDGSGSIRAHFCCAAWSDGVCQSEEQQLQHVDRAVVNGWHQLCVLCNQYGATMTCQADGCPQRYHYPCAAAAGAYIHIEHMRFLCTQHLQSADQELSRMVCVKCEDQGDVLQLLFCTSCGHRYHAGCLDSVVACSTRVRAGWQCPECKVCQQCGWPNDNSKMLVCESCDKGSHTYCAVPALSCVPKNGWKCKNCRQCTDCGSRQPGSGPSSRWHLRYTVCDSCYQQRNKGLCCPVCSRAYRHHKHKQLKLCSQCSKQVHYGCDPLAEGADENYVCPVCTATPQVSSQSALLSSASLAGMDDSRSTTNANDDSPRTMSTADEDDELVQFMKAQFLGGGTTSLSSCSPFSEQHGAGQGGADLATVFPTDLGVSEPSTREGSPSVTDSFVASTAPDKRKADGKRRGGQPGTGKRGRPPLTAGKGSYNRQSSVSGTVANRRGRGGGTSNLTGGSLARHSVSTTADSTGARTISASGGEDTTSQSDSDDGRSRSEDDYVHTVVVGKQTDTYLLSQDLCVICGSIGADDEGVMVACAQCGQCCHTYCANIKMSTVVLTRGWRCLDCTVCEGCGLGTDETHLLLCDDCDVSYHTYCLHPPLERIPSGPWRCQQCAQCVRCKTALPSVVERGNNNKENVPDTALNLCKVCASLRSCEQCTHTYKQDDLLIQCQQCKRWLHGACEQLLNADMMEKACEQQFRCAECRPNALGSSTAQTNEPDANAQYTLDGVLLTKLGYDTVQRAKIRAGSHSAGSVQARLNGRGGHTGSMMRQHSMGMPQHTALDMMGVDQRRMSMDLDHQQRSESVEGVVDDGYVPGAAGAQQRMQMMRGRGSRGRYSKLHKVGVGGFVIRPSRQRFMLQADEPDQMAIEGYGQPSALSSPVDPAKKRKRKNRRSQLEDAFPVVMQRLFFGDSMEEGVDTKPTDCALDIQRAKIVPDAVVANTCNQYTDELSTRITDFLKKQANQQQQGRLMDSAPAATHSHTPAHNTMLHTNMHPAVEDRTLEHAFANLNNIEHLDTADADMLFKMLDDGDEDEQHMEELMAHGGMDEQSQQSVFMNSFDSATTNAPMEAHEPHPTTDTMDTGAGAGAQTMTIRHTHPVPVPGPAHMQTAPAHNMPLQHYAQQQTMPNPAQAVPQAQQQHQPPQQHMHQNIPIDHSTGVPYQHPVHMAGMAQTPVRPSGPVAHAQGAYGNLAQASGTMQPQTNTAITQDGAIHKGASTPSTTTGGGAGNNNTERWEHDEPNGEKSTIAAVLYANLAAPGLKQTHPVWSDRLKQIQKMWRTLTKAEREQYVQMARDNRAACKQQQRAQPTSTTPVPVPAQSNAPGQVQAVMHSPMVAPANVQYPDQQAPQPQQTMMEHQDMFKVPPMPQQAQQPLPPPQQQQGQQQQGQQGQQQQQQQGQQQQQLGQGQQPIGMNTMPNPMTQVRLPPRPSSLQVDAPAQPAQQHANMQFGNAHGGPSMLEDLLEMERRDLTQRQQPAPQQQPHGMMVPGASMTGPPPTHASGPVVPVQLDERQQMLMKQQYEHNQQQTLIDNELKSLRNQKKNLANRQRQHKKAFESQGLDASQQMEDIESTQQMGKLTHAIQTLQKRQEGLKKAGKQLASDLQEYNSRKQQAVMGPATHAQPQAPYPNVTQRMLSPQQQAAMHSPMTRPPPPAPFHMVRPSAPMYPSASGAVPPAQDTMQQPTPAVPVRQSTPVNASAGLASPTTSAAQLKTKATVRKRRRRRDTAVLEGVAQSQSVVPQTQQQQPPVASQMDVLQCALASLNEHVVRTVSHLVDTVCTQIDGPEQRAMPDLRTRMIMLQTAGAADIITMLGDIVPKAVAKAGLHLAGSKPPRKRMRKQSYQKAAVTKLGASASSSLVSPTRPLPLPQEANTAAAVNMLSPSSTVNVSGCDVHQINAFITRMRNALKQATRIPPQQPRARPDRHSVPPLGLTNLPDRADRPQFTCDGFGRVSLKFLPDYYQDVFGEESRQAWQVIRAAAHVKAFPAHDTQPRTRPVNVDMLKKRVDAQMQCLFENSVLEACDAQSVQYAALRSKQHCGTPNLHMNCSHVYALQGNIKPKLPVSLPPDPAPEQWLQTEAESLVPVSLSVSGQAASHIERVMQRLAALLNMTEPIKYDMHIETPPPSPEKLVETKAMGSNDVPGEQQAGQDSVKEEQEQCSQCEQMTQTSAALHRQLNEHSLTFCAAGCFFKYALHNHTTIDHNDIQLVQPGVLDRDTVQQLSEQHPSLFPASKVQQLQAQEDRLQAQRSMNIMSIVDAVAAEHKHNVKGAAQVVTATATGTSAHAGLQSPAKAVAAQSAPAAVLGAGVDTEPAKDTDNGQDVMDEIINSVLDEQLPYAGLNREHMVHVRDLCHLVDKQEPNAVQDNAAGKGGREHRWMGHGWQVVTDQLATSFHALAQQLTKLIESSRVQRECAESDERECRLCLHKGDDKTVRAGRLLNLDAAVWLHVNCALWSSEVYETVSGSLMNCEAAVRRSDTCECVHCHQFGATVQCYKLHCKAVYHFPCALTAQCVFFKDKTMYCVEHGAQQHNIQIMALKTMAVLRRIYIERDENRLIAKMFQQQQESNLCLRVGSLIYTHVGQLLPHQLRAFHNKDFIFPVGYRVTRIYWSASSPNTRVHYQCAIGDKEGQPMFSVSLQPDKHSQAMVTCTERSASLAWQNILTPLQRLRAQNQQLRLFANQLPGEQLFGLNESCISKMIESLPGVDTILTYSFKHGGSPLMDLPLAVNPSGCARCEPRFRTYLKRALPLTHGSASCADSGSQAGEYNTLLDMYQASPGPSNTNSKWSQYKRMKQDWKNIVYPGRSQIHGLGLYAKRDLEMHSMIIEYLGETIRSEVAEVREKRYTAQNRGVYMFRIDANEVVDATMTGGPARYINHSCDPNCTTQIVRLNSGRQKIVVMAARPIAQGEELTYDYQFDIEDTTDKIACFCGAPNCRKWMN